MIQQLRQGAPFPIVAAQFSQADSALQGGDLGFLPLGQLDPDVAAVVKTMPVGAISNPIRVPGGYDVVQLQATHAVGSDTTTTLSMRQTYVPYPTPITNGQVGPAQAAVINKLIQDGHNVHSCSDMEALNNTYGHTRPADPGPVNLADVTPPAFQTVLANLPIGQVSQPLVNQDGRDAHHHLLAPDQRNGPALRRGYRQRNRQPARADGIAATARQSAAPLDYYAELKEGSSSFSEEKEPKRLL